MSDNQSKNNQIPFDEDNYTHNIHKANERSLDRRGFMKMMVGAAGVFAVSTLPWGAIATKKMLSPSSKKYPVHKLTTISDLRIGGSLEFHYPDEHASALLIRLSETEFKAYQNACTHLKCPVFWSEAENEMLCPCHHGKFDVLTGSPLAGPPRRPLPEIVLKQSNGNVYAIGVKAYEA